MRAPTPGKTNEGTSKTLNNSDYAHRFPRASTVLLGFLEGKLGVLLLGAQDPTYTC